MVHTIQIHTYNEELTEAWGVESGKNIFVNRVVEELMPQAVTTQMIQTELCKDQTMLDLKKTRHHKQIL